MFYIYIILLILFICLYFYLYITKILNDNDLKNFLKNDSDSYFKNMSIHDLRARKSLTVNDYIEKVIKFSNKKLNIKDYLILLYCVIKADIFFYNLKSEYLPMDHNIHKILWKFGITKNKNYEEGFPHTRTDIIFIDINIIKNINTKKDLKDFIKLLIHEKIHIYQRYNKGKLYNILERKGYKVKYTKKIFKLVRANPDLDNWIYENNEGKLMIYKYNSANPNGINDVTKTTEYEHPYEMISYIIENTYA